MNPKAATLAFVLRPSSRLLAVHDGDSNSPERKGSGSLDIVASVDDPRRFIKILNDPSFRLLTRLQDQLTRVTTEFWHRRGALNLHLPITTNSISSPMGLGSDSLPVKIDLLGQQTYLADSMQFMLEYGCRLADAGAWYVMPSFRGEDADATHLSQFIHSEAEIHGTLADVKTVVEEYLVALTRAALDEFGEEIAAVAGGTEHLEALIAATPFPSLTLDEAVEHLGDDQASVLHDPAGFRTITRTGERRLMAEISPFVWLTHFDHLSVPFYQARVPGTTLAANADLLFGIGEVVGAGERHPDGASTLEALAGHDVPGDEYSWYVAMKEETPMLTSGFGMGVERWMMWVLNHDDIRDLQVVPRLNGHILLP